MCCSTDTSHLYKQTLNNLVKIKKKNSKNIKANYLAVPDPFGKRLKPYLYFSI